MTKKLSIRILFSIFTFLFVIIPINTKANSEYSLTKYKVDIIVNENNTFNITENISAYFNVKKHGIFRKIPLKNEITRLDGTKNHNRAKISEIEVNEKFTSYNESGSKVIKIGDPNYTLTGNKDYTISYLYNIGKDTGKGYDEFYFNLMGYDWDTTISNIEFTISMPKEFDQSRLGFSSGPQGATDSNNIIYNVVGNTITGRYIGSLNPGEALTVRLELPEGYFVGATDNYSSMITIYFLVPVILAIIAFLLWIKYGRDDKVIETVEFYPPEGFNSAEIGYLYKGQATKEDVVSLLIYLANKGYIKIEETEEKSLFNKVSGFKIIKVKDYDGDNLEERKFLNGLFSRSISKKIYSELENIKLPKITPKSISNAITSLSNIKTNENEEAEAYQEVTSIELKNHFYVTLNSIISSLNRKENKYKIFEKTTSKKSVSIVLMILTALITIISIPTLEYAGVGELATTIFITFFYVPFYAVAFAKGIPPLFRLFWGGFTFLHSMAFFFAMPIREALFDEPIFLIGFLTGVACILIMIFCLKAMPKRTPYGNDLLGKIKGFKSFLETAEKPKLEALVMQNPTYFYNILPYTYVLGISDKWIRKFESIAIPAPDWYSGSTAFNMTSFGNFMSSTMTSASTAMSSSPSSSGGGGSSGGGSSGGGSGGGGGGSW